MIGSLRAAQHRLALGFRLVPSCKICCQLLSCFVILCLSSQGLRLHNPPIELGDIFGERYFICSGHSLVTCQFRAMARRRLFEVCCCRTGRGGAAVSRKLPAPSSSSTRRRSSGAIETLLFGQSSVTTPPPPSSSRSRSGLLPG